MTTPTLVAVIALGVTAIAGVVLVVRMTGSTAGVTETGRAIGALLVAIIRALTDHAS
jgi:hypothetical protein